MCCNLPGSRFTSMGDCKQNHHGICSEHIYETKNGSPELLSNVFLQITIELIMSKKPVLEKMHSDVKHRIFWFCSQIEVSRDYFVS